MVSRAAAMVVLASAAMVFEIAETTVARAQEQKETYVAKLDADGVQRARLIGGEYFFRPARIVVKVNVPVELLASKEAGIVPHNLVIQAPEAGIAVEEELGSEPKKIRFTATAPGKYPFYCSNRLLFFASHRERGMEGVLEVVP
ncbi:MAG TPA: quinol oxidase [Burkholderiales bacterium]|nr:quinol oxidase [Burkholderiales bacterium]